MYLRTAQVLSSAPAKHQLVAFIPCQQLDVSNSNSVHNYVIRVVGCYPDCSCSLIGFTIASWTPTRPLPTSLSPPSFAGSWASSWLAHAGDSRHPLCVKLQCTLVFFHETLCLTLRTSSLSDLADFIIGTTRRPNVLPLQIRIIHGSRRKCWVYYMP